MAKRYGTTGEIVGKRVLLDKSTPKKPEAVKRLGKVRHCVFHPTQRRFVGFIVKRPDLLWMFRRKDVFVAYNGYDVVDGRIVVSQAPEATGKGACKAMGVNYDDCVLWAGLPVMGEDGTVYGTVGDVSFDPKTGEVRSLTVTQGAAANALLGVREIPGHLIRGFKRGIGTALSVNGQDEGEEPILGAILVSDEVAELSRMAGTDFTGFAKTNRVSMKETLSWFEQYLTAHPEVELVYRRHPSEWNSPALEELAKKRPNFHVIFADSVKQWIVAADSISIWMSTAIAEVYMAGKSCHILRPVPIEHEYDPVIYKDAHYVTRYDEFAAAMAEPEPPFPIAKDVIEGYFDPSETPAYKRMADLLEDVYKNPPRDEPMGNGFTPHFNKLKFCALAGVHFLYRRGWEPKKLFAFCPPLANFAQRIYGYVDKAHVTPEQVAAMEARIKPFVK